MAEKGQLRGLAHRSAARSWERVMKTAQDNAQKVPSTRPGTEQVLNES